MATVQWTTAGGEPHTEESADVFLLLRDEWPALPSGPTLHLGTHRATLATHARITESDTLDFRFRFIRAVDYVDQWLSELETKGHHHRQRLRETGMHGQDDEQHPARRLAHLEEVASAALAYYEEQMILLTMQHSSLFTDMWDYGYGETSLRTVLFFELCRLRVIRRELFGPAWTRDKKPQDYPYLKAQRITLPKDRPVGLFTLQEMEQAFVLLFRYWGSMPYHPEIGQFVHQLLDKQATFFCASATREEMDVDLYRNPLRAGSNEQDPFSSDHVGPTLTFTFKAQLRYFNVIHRLYLVCGRRRVPFRELNIKENLPYPYHIISPYWIQSLLENKAANIRAEMHERVREIMMQDLLHPGDREWLSFLRPVAQVTNQMIIDLFHDHEAARYDCESKIKTAEALELAHGSLRTGSRSRVVLDLMDKLLPFDLCFMRDYVIEWPDLLTRWSMLTRSTRPLLVQFFGHVELFWLGKIYTKHPAPGDCHENPVAGMYTHQTIYDTLHMWLRIMAYKPAFETVWSSSLVPQLEEWIEKYMYIHLTKQGNDDETAAQKARAISQAYRERQTLARAHMEETLRDSRLLEVEALFSATGIASDIEESSGGEGEGEGEGEDEGESEDEGEGEAMELGEERTEGGPGGRGDGGRNRGSQAAAARPPVDELEDPTRRFVRPMVEEQDVEDINLPVLTFYK